MPLLSTRSQPISSGLSSGSPRRYLGDEVLVDRRHEFPAVGVRQRPAMLQLPDHDPGPDTEVCRERARVAAFEIVRRSRTNVASAAASTNLSDANLLAYASISSAPLLAPRSSST